MHKAKERLAKIERRHLVAACVVVVVLAAAIVAITVVLVANMQKQPHSSNFSVSGQIVCLPHKNTEGPQTLECAYGLRADDDRYYALQFGSLPMQDVQTGQRVHIKGALTTGGESQYDIVGTIALESLTKP